MKWVVLDKSVVGQLKPPHPFLKPITARQVAPGSGDDEGRAVLLPGSGDEGE